MESEIRLLETTNKGLFEEIRQIRSSYDTKMEKLMKDFHIEIYKVGLSTVIFYFEDFMKQSAVGFVKNTRLSMNRWNKPNNIICRAIWKVYKQ